MQLLHQNYQNLLHKYNLILMKFFGTFKVLWLILWFSEKGLQNDIQHVSKWMTQKKMSLNPTSYGGDGGFHPPLPFFKISLIAANNMVRNTWTFLNYILFKFRIKKISIFWGGTPLRPPWKIWDLFFEIWLRDFWKWY